MKHRFVHRDILKIFPWIKPRTLISWSERNLITPDVSDASGRGSERVYSYANLIEIGIISELLSHGIPFVAIKDIMASSVITQMKEQSEFDVVIWSDRTMRDFTARKPKASPEPRRLPNEAAPPLMPGHGAASITAPLPRTSTETIGCVKADTFLTSGGAQLIGGPKEYVTSVILIHVRGIKTHVDRQIRGIK